MIPHQEAQFVGPHLRQFSGEDMSATQAFLLSAVVIGLSACGSTPSRTPESPAAQPSPSAANKPAARIVKSRDGKYTGEVIGNIAEGSKLAKLQIGMSTAEVQDVFGRVPDRSHTYESGKRWIPFYFGNDAKRMQVLYRGEGCLLFTGGNVWGGAGGDLIQIHVDATGACYQP
jgi:hypothetical protein